VLQAQAYRSPAVSGAGRQAWVSKFSEA
jgi:hypothetical protein